MGNKNSTTIVQTMDVVNQVTTNIVNSATTSGEAKSLNVQKFIFKNEGKLKKCPITIGQEINSEQGLKVFSTFESSSEINNVLQNVIDQTAKSTQTAVSNFISLASNQNENKMDTIARIKNEVATNVTNENLTKCNAFVQNLQQGTFINTGEIDCDGEPITIDQKIINKQVVDCISQTLFNTLASSEIINQVTQKSESDQTAEDKGAFGFLADLAPWVVLGLLVLAVLAGIGVLIYSKMKGGSNSPLTPIPSFSSTRKPLKP